MGERGRPTDYTEEFIEKVDDYLASNQDEEYEFHKSRGDKLDVYEQKIKVRLPTVEGFALYIGVSKRVLYNWEKIYPNFMHALDKIREEQRKRLLNNGLSGAYNPVIAKLVLSANHGMRERADITTNDKELPQPLLTNLNQGVPNNSSNQEVSEVNKEG